MSLNPAEKQRTRQDLQANRQLCPLSDEAIATALGWTPGHLQATLQVTSHPADVWRLRDFLVQAIRESGGTPAPFSVLTDDKRGAAQGWFGSWTVPPTPRAQTVLLLSQTRNRQNTEIPAAHPGKS
ncbi:DUF2316 family protein [Deinococcus sp. PESE-13]